MYRQNCRLFDECDEEWTPLPVHFINGWYNILVPVFELIVWAKCTVKTVGLFAPLVKSPVVKLICKLTVTED